MSQGSDTQTATKQKTRVKRPSRFKVLLLNDDYTTMDFVVSILESVFGHTPAAAVGIMLQVHNEGSGLCGVYPKEIAEAKIALVEQQANHAGHPLKCVMEPEDV